MKNIAEIYNNPDMARYLGPARVIDPGGGQDPLKVVVEGPEGKRYALAYMALPTTDTIEPGDKVLVAGDNDENLYVIGILGRKPASAFPAPKIVLPDGSYASIEGAIDEQKLCVFSSRNELMFQYDPKTGQARIVSDAQNLVIDAPKGDIELNAAKNIRLSGDAIELNGSSGIGLSVGTIFESLRSAFSLKPGQINLSGQHVKVSAKQGRIFIDDLRNHMKSVVSKMGDARLVVDRLETAANSIIEKAKNTYRSTENLNQLKAGRMRMLINSTFHLKSKSSIIKAKDDVKVKGEKIHLG